MFELIKVGIPLQSKDITNEFLNVIEEIKNNPECIAVTTVDFSEYEMVVAPAGYKVILDNLNFKPYSNQLHLNCINTMSSLWGVVRDIPSLIDNILDLLHKNQKILKFKKVYFLNGGSPFCGDSATLCLSKRVTDLKFVTSPSCIDVAYSALNISVAYVENDYVNICIRKQQDLVIDTTKINAFLCMQRGYEYNNIHILNKFFKQIEEHYSDDDIIKLVNIKADTCDIESLTVGTAKIIKEQIYNNRKPVVFFLYKKEFQ